MEPHGGVRVEEADCPTQDCVHTGTITRAGQSIVCLPARIIIRLEGGPVDKDAPDVVIVTTAKTDKEAYALLEKLGMPFKK